MKILLTLFLLPLCVFAQIKIEGKVVDAVTKQPIPYVNIESFKYKMGTQSNQDGLFILELPQGKSSDTIKISCVGYHDKYLTDIQSSNELLVELKTSIIALEEVIIRKGKSILKEVGVLEKTGRNLAYFNQMLKKGGFQHAVLMKGLEGKTAKLKQVHFFIGKEAYKAPFRVRIYENLSGQPGKDLLSKSLELFAYQKNNWNAFDVSQYHLEVPEKGIWVAIEWIANENYEMKSRPLVRFDKDGKPYQDKSTIFTYYGPEIAYQIDSKYGLTYSKSLGEKWYQKRAGRKPQDGDMKKLGFSDILAKATIEVIE
ncbi:carboxypeptidase-like regulatory domain-containing protein [Pedobacter sp. SL55]|uniref:carboxypeptidase-like regulatory domain-containing protein n=1 Tax=Pedobacter sp. SL55 TaxID=2995161 RepID=UPI00226E7B46|nr:carboxypeptidase-like regulatory domain-containing protein [Pedobacter sp. SL55]WAC41513.1 carboxypeptidase-like regulatory domain-containing protein [Pedobacter sp. SL55]